MAKESENIETCPYCGRDTTAGGVTTGQPNQTACKLCWEQRHPFMPVTELHQVLHGDEPFLGTKLVREQLSETEVLNIIDGYNEECALRYCVYLKKLIKERQAKEGK